MYSSKIGGFFSDDPFGRGKMANRHVTVRTNNPGAINGASWQKDLPGFVDTVITSYSTVNGRKVPNKTTIYASPEEGALAYWWLLKRYRDVSKVAMTPRGIVTYYGGGQNYTSYLRYITDLGFKADQKIDLYKDETLLPFAKGMFRYEAGEPIPWTDAQILWGFNMGRAIEQAQNRSGKPLGEVSKDVSYTPTGPSDKSFLTAILAPLGTVAATTIAYLFSGFHGIIVLAIVAFLGYYIYKRYYT